MSKVLSFNLRAIENHLTLLIEGELMWTISSLHCRGTERKQVDRVGFCRSQGMMVAWSRLCRSFRWEDVDLLQKSVRGVTAGGGAGTERRVGTKWRAAMENAEFLAHEVGNNIF